MFRHTELGPLIASNPAEASRRLRELLRKHGGNVSAAAREIEVDNKTLRRWFARLDEAGCDPRAPEVQG